MLHACIFPAGSSAAPKYTVVVARKGGRWLFARHKKRHTWETAGGHIEPGESALECARRELYEETGALVFTLEHVFDYHGWTRDGASDGAVFYAEVAELGPLPPSEMAEISLFDDLPRDMTYPLVTPLLATQALAHHLARHSTARG